MSTDNQPDQAARHHPVYDRLSETAEFSELRKRYDGGESIRSLASSTNRSYGFVHRLLSESGATLRSRGGANRNSKKS